MRHPSGEPVLAEQLLAYACRLSGAGHAFLCRPGPGDDLRCEAATGIFAAMRGRVHAADAGLIGRVWRERLPLFRGGRDAWEGLLPGPPDVGALAVLPLLSEGRRAGVLGLAHEERGRGFNNRGGDLLLDLARFAAALLLEEGPSRIVAGPRSRGGVPTSGGVLGGFTWESDTDRIVGGESLARVLGCSVDGLPATGEELVDRIHRGDRHLLAEALDAAAREGGAFEVGLRLPRSDGSLGFLICHGTVGSGRRIITGFVADVTEAQRLEQRYHELLRRHREILDALPLAVVVKDRQGRVVEVNRSGAGLHGTTPERLRGRLPRTRHDDGRRDALDRAAEEEVGRQGEARRGLLERRTDVDGRERWFRSDLVPLRDGAGEVEALLVCRLVLEGAESLDPPTDAEDAATFLESPDPRVERHNLARLITVSESRLRGILPPRVDLDLRVTAEVLPCTVDADLLHQVLEQLVRNAAEALGEAGGVVTVRCGRRAFSDSQLQRLVPGGEATAGAWCFVEVSDAGRGMAPDVVRRAFEPLFGTKLGGRGMGLTRVQRIVQAHGGLVGLESEEGMGCTVSVLLPTGVAQGGPKGRIASLLSSRGAGVARPRRERS